MTPSSESNPAQLQPEAHRSAHPRENRRRYAAPKWLQAVAVGAVGGFVASYLGVPVAWLIGPLVAGLVVAVFFRKNLNVPPWLLSAAQVAIGLAVGLSFSIETISGLGTHFPAVVIVLAVTAALSMMNGVLLSRWTGIDRASGLIGCVPGAASAMVAAAHSVGADARTVAVLQYVRLLFILIIVPPAVTAWSHWYRVAAHASAQTGVAGALPTDPLGFAKSVAGAVALSPALSPILAFALVVALGALGALTGARLRFPSPYVLGPMLLAALATSFFSDLMHDVRLPEPVFSAALSVIGTSVGVRFNADTLKSLRRMVIVQLGLLIALVGLSASLGYLLHRVTGIDLVTAVMGNVPGGIEGMIAVAFDLDTNAAIVAAMHTIRSVTLLCIGPWIVAHLRPNQSAERTPHAPFSQRSRPPT